MSNDRSMVVHDLFCNLLEVGFARENLRLIPYLIELRLEDVAELLVSQGNTKTARLLFSSSDSLRMLFSGVS